MLKKPWSGRAEVLSTQPNCLAQALHTTQGTATIGNKDLNLKRKTQLGTAACLHWGCSQAATSSKTHSTPRYSLDTFFSNSLGRTGHAGALECHVFILQGEERATSLPQSPLEGSPLNWDVLPGEIRRKSSRPWKGAVCCHSLLLIGLSTPQVSKQCFADKLWSFTGGNTGRAAGLCWWTTAGTLTSKDQTGERTFLKPISITMPSQACNKQRHEPMGESELQEMPPQLTLPSLVAQCSRTPLSPGQLTRFLPHHSLQGKKGKAMTRPPSS